MDGICVSWKIGLENSRDSLEVLGLNPFSKEFVIIEKNIFIHDFYFKNSEEIFVISE
jgi:hypothetical protein